jgi:hypothetical protein
VTERRCRACGGPLAASQPAHHHSCAACYFAGRQTAASNTPKSRRPSPAAQGSLLDTPLWEDACSEYLEYERQREREREAA